MCTALAVLAFLALALLILDGGSALIAVPSGLAAIAIGVGVFRLFKGDHEPTIGRRLLSGLVAGILAHVATNLYAPLLWEAHLSRPDAKARFVELFLLAGINGLLGFLFGAGLWQRSENR